MTEPTLESCRGHIAEARRKYNRDPRELGPTTAGKLLADLEWACEQVERLRKQANWTALGRRAEAAEAKVAEQEKEIVHYRAAIGAPDNACFKGREDDPNAEREWLRGHWKNALDQWKKAKERAKAAERRVAEQEEENAALRRMAWGTESDLEREKELARLRRVEEGARRAQDILSSDEEHQERGAFTWEALVALRAAFGEP